MKIKHFIIIVKKLFQFFGKYVILIALYSLNVMYKNLGTIDKF